MMAAGKYHSGSLQVQRRRRRRCKQQKQQQLNSSRV
jgi:hypothetical protein